MKKIRLIPILLLFTICITGNSCSRGPSVDDNQIPSPNGEIYAEFIISEGNAYYSVYRDDNQVIQNSSLGLLMEDEDFFNNLSIESISKIKKHSDEYTLFTGKRRDCQYIANERIFYLTNGSGEKMNIHFRVSDDGVAFRYEFSGTSEEKKIINEELTSFNFPAETRAWLQPIAKPKTGFEQTNPSYEEHYEKDIPVGTPSTIGYGWVFPSLFKYNDTWMLISEAGLDRTYCASRLRTHSDDGEYMIGFPMPEEVMPDGGLLPESELPWKTPWRFITIGNLKTVVESTLGTDLAKPSVLEDTSWIKPGLVSWSWVLLKDEYTVYDVQKDFIDYSADMNWRYCLIDNLWDTQIGRDSIELLAEYAESKGVGLFLWYNSAGSWNTTPLTPRDKMLTHESRTKEFSWLKELGVKGVKIDFFGGDGRSVIEYYLDIFDDAADYKQLINVHGSTLPRGWHRTYPHFLTSEAVKGMEYITFDQGNADRAPAHNTMQLFTRNVFDPMDYTPMCLSEIPNIEMRTTYGHEMALPVMFTSGVQNMAETPYGMENVPEYVRTYLQNMPEMWDEMEFIDGYPGEYVILARKSGSRWFVAGINGIDNERNVDVDLSFLDRKTSDGILLTDGEDKHSFSGKKITPESSYNITMKGNGGFVMIFDEELDEWNGLF